MNEIGKIYNRPWGSYRTIEQRENYQIKHIIVYPGQRLSLQYHLKRDEHWTIIKGIGKMQLDEEIFELSINESVYIPKQSKHRITNQSNSNIEFIEIQIGTYLGEDDIVRLSDDYGRI